MFSRIPVFRAAIGVAGAAGLLAVAGVTASLFVLGGRAAVVSAAPPPSVKTTIANDVAAFMKSSGTPGLVVSVYDAHQFGTSGYVAPFGVTKYGAKTHVTGSTGFQIGSITKVFSGTLYGDAMGRGYDTTSTTAYKAFGSPASLAHATEFQKITLPMLASHTAGFPDEVGARTGDPLFAGDSTIPAHLISFYQSLKPTLKTGCYRYSSAGFVTLGYALADSWHGALHGNFPAILNAEISQPLHLVCTNTKLTSACEAVQSTGVNLKTHKVAAHMATDVKSTGNDMLKWIEANLGVGPTVPAILAKAIATAQKPVGTFPSCTNGNKVTVGLAWQEEPLKGAPGTPTALTKNGATGYGGESAMIVLVPSKKIGISILTDGLGAGGPDALARSLAAKIVAADAGAAPAATAEPKAKARGKKTKR
ncbi:MAG TPA: serine hydrolase [Candidatus Elarobacter sp.]|jgi:CubicO group peptidase (beta-lactamase class C family)|nr:serine hydrolase [Candidatus Elarobacter sp.]